MLHFSEGYKHSDHSRHIGEGELEFYLESFGETLKGFQYDSDPIIGPTLLNTLPRSHQQPDRISVPNKQSSPCSQQLEKAPKQQWRPSTVINK